MGHRACFAAICLLIAAVTGRTTGAIGAGTPAAFQAAPAAQTPPAPTKPAGEKPAGEKPAAEQPAPHSQGPLPAGYAGSDTCELCHEPQVLSIKTTAHGQAANLRTPAATHGCESCHGPGQAHADSETEPKGHIRTFKTMKPAEISETCTTCHNRGTHAGWTGSAHETRNLSCTTCHSVHSPKSQKFQLVASTATGVCATCPQRTICV